MKDKLKKAVVCLLIGFVIFTVPYDIYSRYMQFRFFEYLDGGDTEKIVAHIGKMPRLSMDILPYPVLCYMLAPFVEAPLEEYPLYEAIWNRADVEVLKALLEKGANPNGKIWWLGDREPIDRMLDGYSVDIYEKICLMVEYGADISVSGLIGGIVRDYEKAPEEVFKTVLYLWEAGVSDENYEGRHIALNACARNMNTKHLKTLYFNEKRPMAYMLNERGYKGETPLICAVKREKYDNCKFLLEQGADTSIKDDEGKTAYDIAVELGYEEIAELLEEYVEP